LDFFLEGLDAEGEKAAWEYVYVTPYIGKMGRAGQRFIYSEWTGWAAWVVMRYECIIGYEELGMKK
jgi:hypothetical protein